MARSTDADIAVTTMRTDVGQLVGTLQYMSPEQAGGTGVSPVSPADIDTRTDVYSLGVVLYELLTGRVPYDVSHMTLHSAMRRICEEPAAKPSEFNRRLRGDLEAITLKALEKDRAKRYQSAAELATDLRHHLHGEPISARPPTRWMRAMRWAARHPKTVTAAACVVFALVTLAATKAVVWWYNEKPFELKRSDDGRQARLRAYSGTSLHLWGGDRRNEIAIAERYPKPDGGFYALIGYTLVSSSPYRGALCAYDTTGNLDEPAWESRIERVDVPPDMLRAGRGPESYQVHGYSRYVITDIFDDQDAPGNEIVVVYNGGFSQCALRILNRDGDVLFQVWQDGVIQWMYWLSEPRLLVCAGNDEYLKLNDRAFNARPADSALAPVVFAIRPVRGVVLNEFMGRTPEEEAAFRPEWAKFIEPPEDRKLHFLFLLDRAHAVDPARYVQLSVRVLPAEDEAPAQFSWLINGRGDVEGSVALGDQYVLDQNSSDPRLPDPYAVRLFDLKPAKTRPPYVKPESASEQ